LSRLRFRKSACREAKEIRRNRLRLTPSMHDRSVGPGLVPNERSRSDGEEACGEGDLKIERGFVVRVVDADEPLTGREDRVDLPPIRNKLHTGTRLPAIGDDEIAHRAPPGGFRQENSQSIQGQFKRNRLSLVTYAFNHEVASIELNCRDIARNELDMNGHFARHASSLDVWVDRRGVLQHVNAAGGGLRKHWPAG